MREDFPLLKNNPDLVYLDSACTSLKPEAVIEAEASYYRELGACAGRSSHYMGRKTNEERDACRSKVAKFVGAGPDGLVWTRNATEALNLVANSFDFSKRRKVITTVMEHHAVLLPFMKLRDRGVIELEVLGCENGEVSLEKWEKAIDGKTALVVTNNANNTTGFRQNVKEIGKMAHDNGAQVCIDGAQGVPHHKTDFKRENLDYLCFSAHKMLGPTGIGALAARNINELDTFIVGGGTVNTVKMEKADYLKNPARFEAGIQDYAGIIGFSAACSYLNRIGMDRVEEHEKKMRAGLVKALEGAVIYGSNSDGYAALCGFNLKGAKPHDVALMLDKDRIAVRSGFFCAQPGMEAMGAMEGAVRASCYIYSNDEDLEKFAASLEKVKQLY